MDSGNPSPDRPEFDELRVLLVDDNVKLRGLIAQTLESHGCRVSTAADANEAVRMLEGGLDVRLLLSDVRMPGPMDGVALAEWVSQRCPRVAVLLVTGFTQTSTLRFPLLSKPFGPEQLIEAMHGVLGRSSTSARP